MNLINIYLIIINIISFLFMGTDKLFAILKKRRISEKTLLFTTIIGGSIGSLLGMFFFRHKIRKPKFLIVVPLSLIILIYLMTKEQMTK